MTEFISANFSYILIALLVLQSFYLVLRRRNQGEGFLSRIFRNNQDVDSTFDRVGIVVILIFMLVAFHDDLTDPTKSLQIVIIFQGLLNLYSQVVLGKSMKDAQQNGHDKEKASDTT